MTCAPHRFIVVASALALSFAMAGCLGGDPVLAPGESDAGPTITPAEAFHSKPNDGKVFRYDYESIPLEGLVLVKTNSPDYTNYNATWYDRTQDIDLCLIEASQGPSCRVYTDGHVSLTYPGADVPRLLPGRHEIVFRVWWGEGTEGQYHEDVFSLYISETPPAPQAYLTWTPSTGDMPLSTDTLRLVIEEEQFADTGANLQFEVEWHRQPPLDVPRYYEDVPGCQTEAEENHIACTIPKDQLCVGDVWSAVVTAYNEFGERSQEVEVQSVLVDNIDPTCSKLNPETDPYVCSIGRVSGQGVRGQYRCSISCSDPDNRSGECDDQAIHYRFEWLQPSQSVDPVAVSHTMDEGSDVLQGRANTDDAALGTALEKGQVICAVYAENDDLSEIGSDGLQGYTCVTSIPNLQPTLGRSCITSYNEDFPGLDDQNTLYTCQPDRQTLADPDDDTQRDELFLYRYEWQRIPRGGNPLPISTDNPDAASYPYHCGPALDSNLVRGDTLCCKAVPRNPDPNSVTSEGTGEFGSGDDCCIEIGNTPPWLITAPELVARKVGDDTPLTIATEETSVRCEVPTGAFFDCDGDPERNYNYEWWVELPTGRYQLHPDGAPETAVLGPENFKKNDVICCNAIPYDGFDYGKARESEVCIPVANTPPRVTDLAVDPPAGPKDEPFACIAQWTDPDAEDLLPGRVTEFYSFVILYADGRRVEVPDDNRDGMLNPGEPATPLGQGDKIHCCLRLQDDTDSTARVCTSDLGRQPAQVNDGTAIIDTVNLVVVDGPEPANELSTLQCVPYGWFDNESDPEGYRYRWYVDGQLVRSDPTGAGGVLESYLDGALFDEGDEVTCEVRTYDGANESSVTWTATVTIADACWTVDGVDLTPTLGHNDAETVYTCHVRNFSDPDPGDTPENTTLTYRWFQSTDPQADLGSPILGPGGTPIATENISGEYLTPNTNERLVCAVVHNCAADPSTLIASDNSAQIINSCPTVAGVVLDFDNDDPHGNPRVGDTVTCLPDGWSDSEGEAERYRYEWRLDGMALAGVDAATLEVVSTMAHRTLSCGVAPRDDYNDDCTLYLSPAMTVGNTPPAIESVVYQPPVVYTDDDLLCVPDGWTDPDGDAPGFVFEWLVNNSEVDPSLLMTTTYDNDTLSSAAFQKDDRVLCRVKPYDGFDEGPTMQDRQLQVRNTLPSIEVTFENDAPSAEAGDNLRCQFESTDADGDNVTGTFRWYRNGTLQALTGTADLDPGSPNVFELDLSQYDSCDRFTCEVIPNDGDEDGLAQSADAQYWGGAALRFDNISAVVWSPVETLETQQGTVDFWFKLESGVANTERVLFAHKPGASTGDHVSVVLAADGSPGLRVGGTQIAKIATIIPIGSWVYYSLQWQLGSWDLLVYVRAPDGESGQWHKVTKSGISLTAWEADALRFGAGSASEAAPVGIIDEMRFSRTRRWDPAYIPFADGLPQISPQPFWLPLQGDQPTLALYHITSDGASTDADRPLTDWTPAGASPATHSNASWTEQSLANECLYLVNVPPPAPEVELRLIDITTTPTVPVNPNYPMHYEVGCDIVRPSEDFNGDEVDYIFRLLVDGVETEQQIVYRDQVNQGTLSVDFHSKITVGASRPCPIATCSVQAYDSAVYSEAGEDDQTLGYANLEDWDGVLNNTFAGLKFGCQTGNICLSSSCITDLGGCVFEPRPGPCDDGDACTGSDTCVDGICIGTALCDDDNQCTTNTCVVVGGEPVCQSENRDGACDDDNVCTVDDQCIDGYCVPGYQRDCNDYRDCTLDSCDQDLGCQNLAAPLDGLACENADRCTINSVCEGGDCVGGQRVVTDDGNQCTIDGCDPALGVYHSPNTGAACELSDPCVENETCQLVSVTVACVGEAKSCNDGNPCTTDGCDSSIPDGCFHLPNANVCNDGDPCTSDDYCANGTCQPGATELVCNDGNPCTTDICQYQVGCRFEYNNDACDDGNACTEGDRCQVGICTGTPIDCNDNNACTLDYCDSIQGCIHLNTTNACDDGNECTTNDACTAGVCQGTLVTCDDGNPCTTDTCDGTPGVGCVYTATPGLPCSDGDPCTVGDHCSDGVCVAGLPKDCDDSNVCTFDTCNAAGDCDHIAQPGSCSDNNACTLEDYCQGGVCIAGASRNCDDQEFCTVDSCDPTSGACLHENKAPNTACSDGDPCTEGDVCLVPQGATLMECTAGSAKNCDDGNPCTLDSCDALGNCIHRNQDNITCDDGNACTMNDACLAGTCVGADERPCGDGNSCTTDTCDPSLGCVNTPKANGATCDDGNPCTVADTCSDSSGTLQCAGTTKSCDDSNTCTADYCDAAGNCQHTNLSGSCDDGNSCTSGDTCQSGVCVGGPTVSCNDNNSCTNDACDVNAVGDPCIHTDKAVGASCTDGDPCTLGDKCAGAAGARVCEGTLNDCSDGNACTTDICQADGSCAYQNLTGGACDDGNACTQNETCQAGVCGGGAARNCDDANSCTVDSCDPTTQEGDPCSHAPLAATTPCDDGSSCTTGDACIESGDSAICQGAPVDCNDGNPCTQDSCNAATGCVHSNSPNGTVCNDGNACTTGTSCTDGVCGGGSGTTCDDANDCTVDSCNPTTGTCVYQPRANGINCSDDDPCTTGDRCLSGTCQAVGPAADGTVCDDLNACTLVDECASGLCVGSGVRDCDDNESCTDDVCIPESGCSNSPLADATPCNDGDACTTGTACLSAVCTGGAEVDCDDSNQCTLDSCDPATGCANDFLLAGSVCEDGNACSDGDTCDGAGVCVAGDDICDICVEVATFSCDGVADMSLRGTGGSGGGDIDTYSGGACGPSTYLGPELTFAIDTTNGSDIEVFWTDVDGSPLPPGYSVRVLEDESGCNPASCVVDSLGTTLRTSTTAGETYYTVLDKTTSGGLPDPRVHVRCISGLTCSDTLTDDVPRQCNMVAESHNLGTNPNYYPPQFTGTTVKDFEGRDYVFTWQGSGGGADTTDVTVFISDGTGAPDYNVFVIYAGAPPADCDSPNTGNTIASNYDQSTNGAFSSVSFEATGSEVYCIVVDSQDQSLTEDFIISVGSF